MSSFNEVLGSMIVSITNGCPLCHVVSEGVRYGTYGRGVGPFHLDDLHCTGDEQLLFQCPHNGLGIHDCGQYDDASVLCFIGKRCAIFCNFLTC